jgi:tetratricopeptide (TPR) repeat protein
MRFADPFRVTILLIAAALGGCATLEPSSPSARSTGSAREARPDKAVSPAVQLAYGNALRSLKAGRHSEAEQALRTLTHKHPELSGPYANLGILYQQLGKHADAAKMLEQAVGINPGRAAYYNQLGVSYRHTGEFAKARDAYLKAVDLDAGYAKAHLNLGILYDIYLWDAGQALNHYGRYLALNPGGDEKVNKWVLELKQRSRSASEVSRKEQG